MTNIERFIRYTAIDTQSDDTTGTTPSTEKQKDLGRVLVKELKELGLTDAVMDEWGNVYAHLPGEENSPHIGFNAHMDTALEVTGKNVKAHLLPHYDGKDISLGNGYVLKVEQFPGILKHQGHDLIITDGTTLLGADDKAGIAIIMSMLNYYHNHKEEKHTNISVAFTVDEEIGEGHKHFDLKKMNADYAYTVDGSDIDAVDYENFNAMSFDIHINGVAVHPGEGKNALINASLLANEIIALLPKHETPFDSEGGEGYWHLCEIKGGVEACDLSLIIRDFETDGILKRKKAVEDAVSQVQKQYPKASIQAVCHEEYTNMRPYVENQPEIIEKAEKAFIKNGLTPKHSKIRGGTDGATFSKMGLSTPNLGTGSYNHHGRYEYLDVKEFEAMIHILKDIVKL